jgi:hypothetical protein
MARELALASYQIEMGAAHQEGRAEGEAQALLDLLSTWLRLAANHAEDVLAD